MSFKTNTHQTPTDIQEGGKSLFLSQARTAFFENQIYKQARQRIQEVVMCTLIIKSVHLQANLKVAFFINKSEQCSFYPSLVMEEHKIKNRIEGVFLSPQREGNFCQEHNTGTAVLKYSEIHFYTSFGLNVVETLVFKLRGPTLWEVPPLSKYSPFLEAVSRSPRNTQSLPGPPAVACSVGILITP